SSSHVGGAHFVLADGHVRFVSENIDKGVYQAVGTIHGGETLGEF
ncbi:MAG: H-X9-DG-CTERM domain-containing protein, partial [Planctomycetaceae bacterium]